MQPATQMSRKEARSATPAFEAPIDEPDRAHDRPMLPRVGAREILLKPVILRLQALQIANLDLGGRGSCSGRTLKAFEFRRELGIFPIHGTVDRVCAHRIARP